jgi:hypothetical protein
VLIAACLFAAAGTSAAEVRLLLPQGRTAFQTNEWIDVSVVRSAAQPLAAAPLVLTLAGRDGGRVTATFAAPAVPLRGTEARSTEHLHVNGHLLRPGKYAVEVAVEQVKAAAEIDIYSHVRQSSFRLINWGRAKGKDQLVQGEDSFGFNLFYGHYAADDDANFIRAGVDFMACCVMSGGHQMDLRSECDWSDPYVTRGGTMRVVRRALIDRLRPNVPGVHYYDEPGLTWEKDPATGESTPHAVRSQARSYVSAFGREPPSYRTIDPANPEHATAWRHWATWKLGFMDAAWKEAQFGVSQVRPDFLSVTQSQYGWSAFTDGYYFNVVRSLPVASGHGGYHDYGPGYFNPSYFLEMARAREFWKPCWYLPTWYGNTTSDQFRLEQYLSFQTNIQGMLSPPDLDPALNPTGRQGIVEANHLMKKLGPIFTALPVTKPPVAMLYSLSQAIHTQTRDRKANYAHAMPQGLNLPLTYLAGKLLQQQFLAVLDEDVVDGTLAADHKAVVLTSLDYLDAQVVAALERFAAGGGLVLLTGDCTVPVRGAIKLPVSPRMPDQARIDELSKAGRWGEMGPYTTTAKYFAGALPLARAIQAELDKAGIRPFFICDQSGIIATRQAAGDSEYLFAVNATPDDSDPKERITPKAAAVTIKLPADGRPVYDAVVGGAVRELAMQGTQLAGNFRFGPGQMRVFARTACPIGGVRVATPVLHSELVRDVAPLRVDVAAALVDERGGLLGAAVPLHIRLLDPLGATRFELYRATQLGQFTTSLPLAANDPAGRWTVVVRDLLSHSEGRAAFDYRPPPSACAIAGITPRAVFAPGDRENAFRFARLFHDVTIVKGKSAFHEAAAKRLAAILEPWGVRCREMPLSEASRTRPISEAEARTWVGLDFGRVKAGADSPPGHAGFAVAGPVILLGNPEDHLLIAYLQRQKFLPYSSDPQNFPGVGRGMVAWQRDGVGRGQESIALIAYDEAGMTEAVGSFYEAVAGMEPLTRWTWPASHELAPATAAPGLAPAAPLAWTATLPDRVVSLNVAGGVLTAITHDGSVTTIDRAGHTVSSRPLSTAELQAVEKKPAGPEPRAAELLKAQSRADRMAKLAAAGPDRDAVAYWGGTLRVVDRHGAVQSEQMLPQDVTALAWLDRMLIVGLADGRVMAVAVR